MRHKKSKRDKEAQKKRDEMFWKFNCWWCKKCECTISKSCNVKLPAIPYQEGMEIVEECHLCKRGILG